ncbi:MAG: N-acetylmuramoyl-L-alanine amidase [Bacillota bacterium]|nr:N-acetylmuramoyl-L-alanine amidase [Bacillota bacterium]
MEVRQRTRLPVVVVLTRRRLAALLAFALVGGLVGGAWAAAVRRPVRLRPLAGRTIALDPGHGGIDSGAHHPESRLTEKEITLDVARRLGRLVRQAGGRAVLTRTDDWESDLPDRAELRRRAAIAEKGRAEILLSLHVDAHSDSSCQYGQVFYHPSSVEGRRLALALQAELLRLQPGNYRRAGAADLFLLRCTDIPSVLVELGFISHPEERHLLNQEVYREELARALLRGITTYFDEEPRPPSASSGGRRNPRMARIRPTGGPMGGVT